MKELKNSLGIKMKRLLKIASVCLLAVSVFSCEIGLGKAVDVSAPIVKIVSPDRADYVQKSFIIEGTSSDNIGVSSMVLQVQPMDNPSDETTMNFRVMNNHWQKLVDSTWEDFYSPNSSVTGNSRKYNWQLEIDLDTSIKTGTDYLIVTQVFDAGNNESKDSKDERSITIDMEEPFVSIILPALKSYENEISSDYSLKDNSVLKNLMNGEFTVSGSQKEDARLDYLVVYLDEKTTTDIDFDTLESECKFSKKVTGDNLRNWSTTIDLSSIPGFEHNRKTVRMITESHDQAGNVEIKVQGWFTYWNDADIPWVVGEFGGPSYEELVAVYPSCSLQGQAYDDDGLKQIEINIYKGTDTTPVKTQTVNLDSENNPTYKAWSVNALGENCKFRIEVNCTDINGNKSSKITRYMSVTDTNPPRIYIESDTSIPMIGDASGNITIEGYVADDGEIESLKLLRVKTGSDPNQLINYYNDAYAEWKRVSPNGVSSVSSNGNKLWEIPLHPETIVNSEHRRQFSKTFNIFTDFGINGTSEKLTTQNFIVYASDGSSCKIDSFTIAGDIEAPEISIDNMIVKTSAGVEKASIDFAEYNETSKSKKLQPFNRNNANEITDKIILSGKWSDNTTNIWSDKSKKGKITLNWDGLTQPVTITTDDKNQTWTTNPITPPDSTTAIISVEFVDFGGNSSKANENFFISSSNPELMNISSQKNDGFYNAKTTIPITLEFNKAVTFAGGSENPTLTINVPEVGTKKTINYVSGNGTTTHVFEYNPTKGDDVAVLDVTKINANGNVWKDLDGNPINSMAIPFNDNNKLKGSRTISIDTIAPEFKSIKAISSPGAYSAGKEIFILAEFTEDVKITDVEKIKLQINESASTNSTVQTGSNSVLFTYLIENKHNFEPLKITAISLNGAQIVDIAGNPLVKTTLPECTGFDQIITDTVVPAKPTIIGLTENDVIYNEDGVSFTLGGIEQTSSVKKYSVDGGKSWSDYTGKVILTNNGDYNITAYQQDIAGNKSENADFVHINIDTGNILTSISAGIPTGTYTTGKVIPIYLNFRKNVNLDTASLSLNLSNGQTAEYESGSGTTQAKFNYTVQQGDYSDGLNVTQINGTFTDEGGKIIDSYVKDIPAGKNLLNSRIIKIITDKPVIKSVALSQTGGKNYLNVEFSTNIFKGNGNITLTHDATSYKAPAVLTPNQFNNYYATETSIADYYTLGSNGSDANCVSDLSEKYVLNYNIETNNQTLINALKTANADKVIVPVNSTYVKVVNKKTLQITLDGTFKLPVKGAAYSIKFDEGLIKDSQNNPNELTNTHTITLPGVESPVIRINKLKETITNINERRNTATITQPLQTSIKIDCQTPDVVCYYQTSNSTNTSAQVGHNPSNAKNSAGAEENPYLVEAPHALAPTIEATALTSGTTRKAYSGEFSIGLSSEDDNRFKGFVYLIATRATKTENSKAVWSDAVYETAYRTAVKIKNDFGGLRYRNFWIRGGDNTSSEVETKDFPFSWNSEEFDKVRAMTETAEGSDEWYWVTWSLNKIAYVGFVNGNIPKDADVNGPSEWCWGDCGFVAHKSKYPLYPGSSLSFYTSVNWGGWVYMNQEKKVEYRDGSTVIRDLKPAGESAKATSTKTTAAGNSIIPSYVVEVKYTKATGDEYAIELVNPTNASDIFYGQDFDESELVAGREYTLRLYTTSSWDAGALRNNGVKVNGYGINITSATLTALSSSITVDKADWQYKTGKTKLRITYKKKYSGLSSYYFELRTVWGDGEQLAQYKLNSEPAGTGTLTLDWTSNKTWDNYSSAQWNGMVLHGIGLEIVKAEWIF